MCMYVYVRGLQANQKVAQDLWHLLLLLLLPVLPLLLLPVLPLLLSLVIGTSMLILKSSQVLREGEKATTKGKQIVCLYAHTHTDTQTVGVGGGACVHGIVRRAGMAYTQYGFTFVLI